MDINIPPINNKYILVPMMYLLESFYGMTIDDINKILECEDIYKEKVKEAMANSKTFKDAIRVAIEKTVRYIASKHCLSPLTNPIIHYEEEKIERMRCLQKEMMDRGIAMTFSSLD